MKYLFGLLFVMLPGAALADPATLAVMFGAGGAATIGTIATIASPVLGVMSAISGNAAANRQGRELERQANEERVMANVEAEQMRRTARQRQSAARVSMAEGGALSGTGFDVLDQNAYAMELDALTVQFRGEQKAKGTAFAAQEARKSASPLNIFSAAVRGFNSMDPLNISG